MTTKTKILNFVQKYTMIIALVLVTAFFAWRTNGKLLLPQNLTNIIAQNAYVFVLATGMLLCILTGGNIDLSVGSVVCFVGTVGAVLMQKNLHFVLAVLIMLAAGLLIGAWQAFWIAYVKVPPFITTLSGMLIFRGLSNVVLEGQTVSVTNEIFVKLFGGGTAKLFLTDEKNVLESGVEIVVQIPDKKQQSLSALSGGERALTVIALLFSFLRVRPAPFSVLDEIDAPLDEANIARFGRFLREFSERTQFVIVTHRKGTMEAADTMYGITLEDAGVSKIISVRLDDIDE